LPDFAARPVAGEGTGRKNMAGFETPKMGSRCTRDKLGYFEDTLIPEMMNFVGLWYWRRVGRPLFRAC
jgi:hypothetical protein